MRLPNVHVTERDYKSHSLIVRYLDQSFECSFREQRISIVRILLRFLVMKLLLKKY